MQNFNINKKKVLFVIPPYFSIESLNNDSLDSIPVFTVPYGLLSLIAYIKKFATVNVEFKILDLNLEAFRILKKEKKNVNIDILLIEILQKELDSTNYDIVGITALFNNAYPYLDNLSKCIKLSKNSPLCVVGGGLASNLYHNILKTFTNIDAICLSEGEIPLLDLINSMDFKSTINSHKSWITLKKIDTNFIFEPSYIFNLDDIPFLEYDLLDLEYYNGRSIDKRFNNDKLKREFSIHTSRGCPYNCTYCSNTSIHGKKMRYMSVEKVVSEIDYLIENYGLNVLLIEDDHFLSDVPRAIKILNEFAKKNIRIEFPNGLAVRDINEELGTALKNAGVSTINLAIESGSTYVLKKLIRKAHSSKHIKPAVDILKKNNIRVHAFIVLGLPGEMDEHREETKNMLIEVGIDWAYIFLAVPIAGSQLYDICEQNDYLIEKDFSKHLVSSATIKAPGVDPEKIQKEMYLMNLEVNFIKNWNVHNGHFDIALPYFENMIRKYPKHAFGYFVLYKIYQKLNYKLEELNLIKEQFNDLITSNDEWKEYSKIFGISKID